MTRGVRSWVLFAAALMVAGTALPWGWARSIPWNEVVSVGAFGNGGEYVLVLAALLAAAALLRRGAAAVILAGLSGLFLLCLAWELPGTLLMNGGAGEAGIGLGLDLALLGAFIAGCAAAVIVVRALDHAALSSMAQRHAMRAGQERPPA